MNWMSIAILVVFFVLLYFMMIRPQKKKEQQINDMRNSIQAGDEIVTIGGICGRVVKTREDSLVIQVGADRVKFEVKRWSVSTVEKKSDRKSAREIEEPQTAETKKIRPKRLGRKAEEEAADEAAEAAGQSGEPGGHAEEAIEGSKTDISPESTFEVK